MLFFLFFDFSYPKNLTILNYEFALDRARKAYGLPRKEVRVVAGALNNQPQTCEPSLFESKNPS